MKTEPILRALDKAYRRSPKYVLDQLLAQENRWKRKATIAQNKLVQVRNRINAFATSLADPAKALQKVHEDHPSV